MTTTTGYQPALAAASRLRGGVTWGHVDELLTGYRARLCERHRSHRAWRVPARTGGTFRVEVSLRPRWCSIAVDRWHTTDRPAESEAWFREHVWPAVEAAHQVRRSGAGFLPSGGGAFTRAEPLARDELLDVLRRWVEAESMW